MVLTSPIDRVTTLIDGSSCLRSRAGSDKEVTKETAGCSARGWSGILKGQEKGASTVSEDEVTGVGKRVASARKLAGWTQNELAR